MPVNNKPNVDIVIPVYGRFDLLDQCIDAVRNSDYAASITLVDNASPNKDEADQYYSKLDRFIRVIRNKTNLGFPTACNVGANKSPGGKYLLFLNSDCIVQPDAIRRTVETLEIPGVGLVGLKLLFPKQLMNLDPRFRPTEKIQHAGVSINIRGQVHHPFVGWDKDHKKVQALENKDLWAITGAYFLTTRNLFNNLQMFSTKYGVGTYEDVDFCMKVHAAKQKIRIVVDTYGYHYVGASAETYNIQYPLNNNRQIFLSEWSQKPPMQWSDWVYL